MWSNLTADSGPNARWVFFHWYRQTQLSGPCPLTKGMSFLRSDITIAGTETRKRPPPSFWKHAPRSSSHPHAALQAYMLLRNSSHACLLRRWLDTIFCHGGNDSVVETCTLGNINPSVAVSVLSHSFSAKTAKNLPHFSAGDCGSFRLEREGAQEKETER